MKSNRKQRSRPAPPLLRPEVKYISRVLPTFFSSVANTWTELDVSNIGQGTSVITRIGSRVLLRSISVHMIIAQGSNATALDDPWNVVRLILATYIAGASATPLATAGASINSVVQRNANTQGRLVTKYYDDYVPLEVASIERASGDGYAPSLKRVSFTRKLNIPVTYGTDAATYADKILVLSMISDSTTTVNPGVIEGYSYLEFVDN